MLLNYILLFFIIFNDSGSRFTIYAWSSWYRNSIAHKILVHFTLSLSVFWSLWTKQEVKTNKESCIYAGFSLFHYGVSKRLLIKGKNTIVIGCGKRWFSLKYPLITVEWRYLMWWKLRILSVRILKKNHFSKWRKERLCNKRKIKLKWIFACS